MKKTDLISRVVRHGQDAGLHVADFAPGGELTTANFEAALNDAITAAYAIAGSPEFGVTTYNNVNVLVPIGRWPMTSTLYFPGNYPKNTPGLIGMGGIGSVALEWDPNFHGIWVITGSEVIGQGLLNATYNQTFKNLELRANGGVSSYGGFKSLFGIHQNLEDILVRGLGGRGGVGETVDWKNCISFDFRNNSEGGNHQHLKLTRCRSDFGIVGFVFGDAAWAVTAIDCHSNGSVLAGAMYNSGAVVKWVGGNTQTGPAATNHPLWYAGTAQAVHCSGTEYTSGLPGTVPHSVVGISHASPAVVSWATHGLTVDSQVVFTSTGTLPAGLTSGVVYYVISSGLTPNTFEVSATQGGSAINTTTDGTGQFTGSRTSTVTISNASPAVVSKVNHGLSADSTVVFTTTGSLPTGLSPNTLYYVISSGLTANSFEVSATQGGSAINTSSAGSGVHTVINKGSLSVASGQFCTLTGLAGLRGWSYAHDQTHKGAWIDLTDTNPTGPDDRISGLYRIHSVLSNTSCIIRKGSDHAASNGDITYQVRGSAGGANINVSGVYHEGGAYALASIGPEYGSAGFYSFESTEANNCQIGLECTGLQGRARILNTRVPGGQYIVAAGCSQLETDGSLSEVTVDSVSRAGLVCRGPRLPGQIRAGGLWDNRPRATRYTQALLERGAVLVLDARNTASLTFSGSNITGWRDLANNIAGTIVNSGVYPTYTASDSEFGGAPSITLLGGNSGAATGSFTWDLTSPLAALGTRATMTLLLVGRIPSVIPVDGDRYSYVGNSDLQLRMHFLGSGYSGNHAGIGTLYSSLIGGTLSGNANVWPADTHAHLMMQTPHLAGTQVAQNNSELVKTNIFTSYPMKELDFPTSLTTTLKLHDYPGGDVGNFIVTHVAVLPYNISIEEFEAFKDMVRNEFKVVETPDNPTVSSALTARTSTVTITIAFPGVISWTSHGLVANRPIRFTTTGSLPAGIAADTTYYVSATGLTANSFQISDTPGGAVKGTGGSQSGTHTATAHFVVNGASLFGVGADSTVSATSSVIITGPGAVTLTRSQIDAALPFGADSRGAWQANYIQIAASLIPSVTTSSSVQVVVNTYQSSSVVAVTN